MVSFVIIRQSGARMFNTEIPHNHRESEQRRMHIELNFTTEATN